MLSTRQYFFIGSSVSFIRRNILDPAVLMIGLMLICLPVTARLKHLKRGPLRRTIVLHLSALLRRHDALVADSIREKNRLEKCRVTDTPAVITESIENMLRSLSAELKRLDTLMQSHLDCVRASMLTQGANQ